MVAARERLEDTVTYLANDSQSPLSRTALVKLLYFTDLRSYERLGRSLTGIDWIWHNFGPFSAEIYETLSGMEARDEIATEVTRNPFGSPEYRLHLREGAGYFGVLSSEDTQIIADVLSEFGRLTPQRLAELSYYTHPMQNVRYRGQPLDFSPYERSPAPAAYVLDVSVPPPAKMSQ